MAGAEQLFRQDGVYLHCKVFFFFSSMPALDMAGGFHLYLYGGIYTILLFGPFFCVDTPPGSV